MRPGDKLAAMGSRPRKKPAGAASDELHEIEAALLLRMSPELLQWFTQFAPKHGDGRKLPSHERGGVRMYRRSDLTDFDEYLWLPWPLSASSSRPAVPMGIRSEIITEAHCACAVCRHGDDGEAAHITPVSDTYCNHPHNLIWLCPNHHTRYDHGVRPHAAVDAGVVRFMKSSLLNSRMRILQAEYGASRVAFELMRELEQVRAAIRDPANAAAAEGLDGHAKALVDELRRVMSRAANTRYLEGSPGGEAFETFARDVIEITRRADDVSTIVDAITQARASFLRSASHEIACPLCTTRDFGRRCPLCDGLCIVSAERASEVTENDFADVDCPICQGHGFRDEKRCPACWASGWLFGFEVRALDLTAYDDVDCPICGGTGELDGRACRACDRRGTVLKLDVAHLDALDFADVRCPLCHETGKHQLRGACPICNGVGRAPKDVLDHTDVYQYQVRACGRCKGSGTINSVRCMTCRGMGAHERGPR